MHTALIWRGIANTVLVAVIRDSTADIKLSTCSEGSRK